jgi:hypothetical protein
MGIVLDRGVGKEEEVALERKNNKTEPNKEWLHCRWEQMNGRLVCPSVSCRLAVVANQEKSLQDQAHIVRASIGIEELVQEELCDAFWSASA